MIKHLILRISCVVSITSISLMWKEVYVSFAPVHVFKCFMFAFSLILHTHAHRCWTAASSAREQGMMGGRLKGAEKGPGSVRTPQGRQSDLWKFHLESPGSHGATARRNSSSVWATRTRSKRQRLNATRKRPVRAKRRDDCSRTENWCWSTPASLSTSPSHRSVHNTCHESCDQSKVTNGRGKFCVVFCYHCVLAWLLEDVKDRFL